MQTARNENADLRDAVGRTASAARRQVERACREGVRDILLEKETLFDFERFLRLEFTFLLQNVEASAVSLATDRNQTRSVKKKRKRKRKTRRRESIFRM